MVSRRGALGENPADIPMKSFEISNLDFANPIDSGNVLQDFDFDSFLHDGDAGADSFDFSSNFDMAGSEITTE